MYLKPGPQQRRPGRGYSLNTPGRFSTVRVESSETGSPPDDTGGPLPTQLLREPSRSIVSTNASPDIPFDRSINPYRGCEHGCVYCYARPTHSYLDHSPALDFETLIYYKDGAADLLRRYLARKSYRCSPITIGANTDPYQPAEKKLGITRQLLEVFVETRHPVSLITKGTLIERDIDLLQELSAQNLNRVCISLPTLNNELKRSLEPRVASSQRRLKTMSRLAAAGLPVTVMVAPVIPALTDHEIESILGRSAEAGADSARYIMLRLPNEVSPLFQKWLVDHEPGRAAHVMSLVRGAAGGKDYDSRFGHRQRGQGPYAEMIAQRFRQGCRRYGLRTGGGAELATHHFRAPKADARQAEFDLQPKGYQV